jgi:hypothetical protein
MSQIISWRRLNLPTKWYDVKWNVPEDPGDDTISKGALRSLWVVASEFKWTYKDVKEYILQKYNLASTKKLTYNQLHEVLDAIESNNKRKDA